MAVATDPIADFLTRIRNASRAGKENVTTPASKRTIRIAEILKEEGYIENVKVIEDGPKKWVRIHLKYLKDRQPMIRTIQRISRPGLRNYVSKSRIPRVLSGMGMAVLSTSRGILTDRAARQENVGGELILKVW